MDFNWHGINRGFHLTSFSDCDLFCFCDWGTVPDRLFVYALKPRNLYHRNGYSS